MCDLYPGHIGPLLGTGHQWSWRNSESLYQILCNSLLSRTTVLEYLEKYPVRQGKSKRTQAIRTVDKTVNDQSFTAGNSHS